MTSRVLWLLLVLLLAMVQPLRGQDAAARLSRSFAPATYTQLMEHVEEARRSGLPAEALVQKALEGRSKGADDRLIVSAVASLRERLLTARAALGTSASDDELQSAAAALYVGASVGTLRVIQQMRPPLALASAYTTLAFLLQQGVGEDASTAAVAALAGAGSTPADFQAFQHAVTADIAAGRIPRESLDSRLGEFGRRGGITPTLDPASAGQP